MTWRSCPRWQAADVYAAIVRSAIGPAGVLAGGGREADGAVVLFLGTVRDHNDGRPVRGLRYEAYEEMARAELEAIAREAGERAGTEEVAVVHRVGELAEEVGHRPDVELAWGKVGLTVWTHKIDGLHEADFVFAAKADRAHEEWAASSTSA